MKKTSRNELFQLLNDERKFINLELSGLDLSSMDFTHCKFENVDFSRTLMNKSDFRFSTFSNVNFENIYLDSPAFFDSEFYGSKFKNLKINLTYFDFSDFSGCSFNDVHFYEERVASEHLSISRFKDCQMQNIIFKDGALSETVFINCNIKDSSFENSYMPKSFWNSKLTSVSFINPLIGFKRIVYMKGAILHDVDLSVISEEILDWERGECWSHDFMGWPGNDPGYNSDPEPWRGE